ncbi:low affinity immunoglobulin gamma Fc region receptor II-a-like protein [Lates japonicus]|nr:low affinity immunoglobulin gamma Fc region receptor II-a-like protein [Lates japonicus]
MEVTALRLMINMWLLLQVQDSYCALKAAPSLRLSSDAAFLRVTPARLQHFEYKSVSFDCEGFDGELGLRVMKKSQNANTCSTNRNIQKGSLCTIETVYIDDSGEYWCETGDGKKSDTVNITVTVFQKETIAICSDQLPVLLYLFVRIVGTMLWAALLLLVLRKRDSGKDRGK